MRCVAVPLVAIATLIAVIGCGPSLRRMHRSEVYFERCYAADFDPNVPIAERRACWQDWMVHWQADQPPDRVDYVRERMLRLDPERAAIVALATGSTEPDDAAPEIAAEATTVTEVMGREPSELGAPPGDVDAGVADAAPSDASVPEGEPVLAEDAAAIASVPAPDVVVAEDADSAAASPIGTPESAPRTIAPARDRRAQRAPVLPASDQPHCAETCRPAWVQCTERCATGDRLACIRACRLELRACSRACY